ncbi:acyl carrier protein [Streptomyces sp. NK08204]|uniref:acyl carrier protein n=1 Tax=Streptomyces sp. NK08204 TaxID=2873260 RepID=UPI001CEC367C|nr:acyl carrier protein [Streptomyces sp. NK08204]
MNDPRTAALVSELIDLWEQVLGTDGIGPDDDFFELGGSSIAAIRLAPLMGERLGVEPELTLLFDHPTPAELAAALAPLAGDRPLEAPAGRGAGA